MSTPILATKLYIPPPRPQVVSRPRLIERLNEGLSSSRKLTLISASAGFGKTTLVSEWVANCARPAAWLSLDEGDNDATRFLTYLIAALQTLALSKVEGIAANIGKGVLGVLQSTPPPSVEAILTTLLNEIATIPRAGNFILVLDDYHVIESKPVDDALTFLLDHLPPQMHLVIATREDPHLPVARLRARGQLTELRVADLRFTPAEAAEFLNQVMGLVLSAEEIAALETRTEGWIAGLQLAAISMQGHKDTAGFIQSFTGSHRFIMDYLVEQVLGQQPEHIQQFLLRTSILDRMCGPLCDAVLGKDEGRRMKDEENKSSFILHPSSLVLEYLERANLFIVPLDNERRWYRYHHLFGDLLRRRLGTSLAPGRIAELHIRASEWFENNDLMLDAFHHATIAADFDRAVRLMESKKMLLDVPGTAAAILNWLESLPTNVLNAQPALWWKQAAMLMEMGKMVGVEEKLQATEAALSGVAPDDTTRNLIGKIAVARALIAQTNFEQETSLVQVRRALEYLHPNNLAYRSTATQVLGFAAYLQGDLVEANRAYVEALALAESAGDVPDAMVAITRLGQIQESRTQFYLAEANYKRALQMIGEHPPSTAAVVYLGLARILYAWNDLDAAEQYGEQSLQLARQYDQILDRIILSELFLARLKLTRGDASGAARILARTEQTARQKNFTPRLSDIAATQALLHLRQGNPDAAAQLAQQYNLPLIQVRVLIAQKNFSAALAILEREHQQSQARGWVDRLLIITVLQSIALDAQGEKDRARQTLRDALTLAEPGGLIRTFVDEGEPMRLLLGRMKDESGRMKEYIHRLLAAFGMREDIHPSSLILHPLVEPLSARELEVLQLIAQGLSNREISERLFLALSTVKGHSRIIFDKLQVRNRTEAVARGRELGLL